jgi:putative acetyltransferase
MGMTIRPERPGDEATIYRVQRAAFGAEPEARIVELMRATDRFIPELSLLAEKHGDVVGHVLVTHTDLVTATGTTRVPLLGPIGVLPERQGVGIGSALMRTALAAADARGEPLVVLEGNPAYYRRFGFILAHELGIDPPPRVPAEYFQVVRLSSYAPTLRGRVLYADPFAAFVA